MNIEIVYLFLKELVANLTMYKTFSSTMPKITLTQSNPDAPTFMTICANPISEKEEIYSALIHSFGDISEDGEKCQSFGPHFNPYGVKKFREKKLNCLIS